MRACVFVCVRAALVLLFVWCARARMLHAQQTTNAFCGMAIRIRGADVRCEVSCNPVTAGALKKVADIQELHV